ncbi:hypothetical protein CL630_01935 [bacterium]|nr:hypothetical protein [bacterium]|tara:strand:+ start:3205 stop:4608 length:1404 start_codon:yes stop_codon:yes gene_type:complete
MKTIFIFISQSVIVKNVLRSGGFELLKKTGHNIVIFIKCKEIPEYMKKEFAGENVVLVPVFGQDRIVSRWQSLLGKFGSYFLWNDTSKQYFRYTINFRHKPRVVTFIHIVILRVISGTFGSTPFTRKFIRWVSFTFFPEKFERISAYFDEYKPDLVFSTSITSKIDSVFIKEAKRRGILTVSMPKTWDTITRTYFNCPSDYFLVQNEILKEHLIKTQDIPAEKIYVIGFPEFDWYARKEIIRTREEHCKRMGLDPTLPVLFFGSQGKWYPNDETIADALYGMIHDNELVKPCQLLVRPYFVQLGCEDKFLKFKNLPKAAYDDTYHMSPAFTEGWDPTTETTIDFVNTIYHSDILIIVLSTLALDGMCFMKPVINTLFGSLIVAGEDISRKMSKTTHYKWIFDTEGTSVAHSRDDLKMCINEYLQNPQTKAKERAVLKEKLCYKLDGKSSSRMVEAIQDILTKNSSFL